MLSRCKNPPSTSCLGPHFISLKLLSLAALLPLVATGQWGCGHGTAAHAYASSGTNVLRGRDTGARTGLGGKVALRANSGPGVDVNPTTDVSTAHVDILLLLSLSF